MEDTQVMYLTHPWPVKHIPIKRIFDCLLSCAFIIFASPLFFIVALAIACTSRGKIVYGHKRVGRGGKPFYCYKFRTMYRDADQRLKDLLLLHPDLKKEWEKTYKLKNDPRITSVGRFLRKTSLDELPQFFNVLKGDLSIVGPRPVVEEEVQKYLGVKAPKILSIRPGITGLWQVSGRSDTCYVTRVKLDEEYVDNQSLGLDFKLMIKTVPAILSSRGAY